MLTAEQLEIRAMAREFAEGEIRPHTAVWDERRAIDETIFAEMAELGFLGMRVPERYGGLELDMSSYLVVLEQIAWGDAALALALGIHNGPVVHLLTAYGSDAQKERWLPQCARDVRLSAFALTEPEAGSDARSLTTEAVRSEDGWRIRGRKRWITNGARAGLVVVFARTSSDAVGAFLVDPETPGWEVTGVESTMGFRASGCASVSLDLQVDDDALLGDPEAGYRYALEALDVGRLGVAALSVGLAQAALDHAGAYAGEREQFGRPIGEFGAIQGKLADVATGTRAARALVAETAEAFTDAPQSERRALAAMCKLFASENALRAADEAVQIFGGYGYMRDYPVERLLRDAKGLEIFEGTNEIMRHVIARDVLAR